MGYLPAALRNYLARLGWSHGDDEIFSTEQADRLVRPRGRRQVAGALRLRQARGSQRALHPRHAATTSCWSGSSTCCRISTTAPQSCSGSTRHACAAAIAMPGLKERAKTLVELLDGAGFLFAERPLALDDKAQGAARRRTREATGVPDRPISEAAATGGAGARSRSCALRRGDRRQARQDRAAFARGADRPDGVAAGVRRDGRARERGSPGAHSDQAADTRLHCGA